MAITSAQQTEILKIFIGLFNAAPGSTYLTDFANYIGAGGTTAQLAQTLAADPAFTSGIMAGLATPVAKVMELMTHFGLSYSAVPVAGTADGEAQIWFSAQVNAGRNLGDVVYDAVTYLNSAAAIASPVYGNAAQALSNKAAVAAYHSSTLAMPSGTLASLQSVVAGVTATTPVATNADLLAAMSLAYVSGSTFALTTGVDYLFGTSGNDTINGSIGTGVSTLTVADVLNGGSGTDTLLIASAGTSAPIMPAASVTNVEIVQITDAAAGPGTYDLLNAADVLSVINMLSTNAVTLRNIVSGASLTVQGNGVTANGSTTFSMAAATDAVTLNLAGGLAGAAPANVTRAATGAASITVNSFGAANRLNLLDLDTGTALTGLTINATTNLTAALGLDYAAGSVLSVGGSAAAVDLSGATLSGNFSLLDASGMNAGGVVAKLGANTTKFIGGAGNDTVAVDALVYSGTGVAAVNVAGGNGFDSLRLTDQAALTAATSKNLTSFEELVLADDNDNAADTFDISLLAGVSSIKLNAVSILDSYVLNNLSVAQAASVTIAGSQETALTLNVYGAATAGQIDTLSIAISDGLAGVNPLTMANLVAANVEIVNFTATDNFTAASLAGLSALTTLTVTGGGAVSLTTGALVVKAGAVVDASAVTGSFTFSGAAATANGLTISGSTTGANTIVGTSLVDTITGGGGADTVTGGAGADSITLGAGADTLVFNSLSGVDVVSDYVVANDGIQFSRAVFTGLGAVGALAASEFESGAGLVAAATVAGRVVYDTTAGNLYYDADGSGVVVPVLIGTFTGAPVLVVGEFAIVA